MQPSVGTTQRRNRFPQRCDRGRRAEGCSCGELCTGMKAGGAERVIPTESIGEKKKREREKKNHKKKKLFPPSLKEFRQGSFRPESAIRLAGSAPNSLLEISSGRCSSPPARRGPLQKPPSIALTPPSPVLALFCLRRASLTA